MLWRWLQLAPRCCRARHRWRYQRYARYVPSSVVCDGMRDHCDIREEPFPQGCSGLRQESHVQVRPEPELVDRRRKEVGACKRGLPITHASMHPPHRLGVNQADDRCGRLPVNNDRENTVLNGGQSLAQLLSPALPLWSSHAAPSCKPPPTGVGRSQSLYGGVGVACARPPRH